MKNLVDYILEGKTIQGLNGYTYEEVCDIVRDYVQDVIDNNELDIEIVDVQLHGSRLRGQAREDSDLDAVVEYSGTMKEDSVFNIIHDEEEQCMVDDLEIDINPIRKQESGDMKSYMKKSAKYDADKLK